METGFLYLDESMKFGGGGNDPSCCGCKQPIRQGERSTRVHFDNDPHGAKGLTGEYHLSCSKPFASLAHVINLKPFG
jgi:hypothetical protein